MTEGEISTQLAHISRRMDGLESIMRQIRDELTALRGQKDAANRKYAGAKKTTRHSGENKPHRAPTYKKGRKYPKP